MSKNRRLTLEPLEDRIVMDTYTVTRLTDLGKGRSVYGDLRYCITQSNANPGEDLIIFGVTGTINLTSALPDLGDDVIIAGPGADQVTVRRSSGVSFRVFTIAGGVNAQIYSLTIANGSFSNMGGSSTWGGGIRNSGVLTLGASTVRDNHVIGFGAVGKRGGGISNEGVMLIFDSTISGNSTSSSSDQTTPETALGGGIYNHTGATLTIINSTVAENTAIVTGGANFNSARGGGINHGGASLEVRHSTISANTASSNWPDGAGISGGNMVLENSIVSGNSGAGNVSGAFTGGFNLIDADAMLGPLTDNGGPTETMALLPGSPAIGAGDNAGAPEFDQRGPGFPRIVNGTVDIGAFEVQATGAPSTPEFHAILITADLGKDD